MKRKKRNILTTYKSRIIVSFTIILGFVLVVASVRSYFLIQRNASQKIIINMQADVVDKTLDIKDIIEKNSNLVSNLSIFLGNYEQIEAAENRREFYQQILLREIEENYSIYSIWTVFKPYTIDKRDVVFSKPYEAITGQYVVNYNREGGKIKLKGQEVKDYEVLDNYVPLLSAQNQVKIIGPIEDPYWGLGSSNSHIIRLVAPILNNNNIVGLVGIDINLKTIKEILNKTSNNALIINDDFQTIFSTKPNLTIGKSVKELLPNVNYKIAFLQSVTRHKKFSNKEDLFLPDEELFYATYPVFFPILDNYWTVITYQNSNITDYIVMKAALKVFVLPVIIFIIILIIIVLITNDLVRFFSETAEYLDDLSDSSHKKFKNKRKNIEMRKIQNNILNLSAQYYRNKDAITEILNDRDVVFDGKRTNSVGEGLLKIHEKLELERKTKEEQVKQQEIVNIISKGIAEINDIQRKYSDEIEELGYETIKYISDYTNSVQGGFYIFKKQDIAEQSYLELTACYSYNRRVYNNKKIEIGDGLAGTCAQEKQIIYSKVPEDYLEITSGLGTNPPNYIYLLPLTVQDTLYGVVEIAFLEKMEEYQLKFMESVSEIIASTIARYEINLQTRRLLEQTQKISDDMREKEEAMGEQIQELYELKSQSELLKLQQKSLQSSINHINYYAEFDTSANVLTINDNLSEKIQIQKTDVMMMTYYDIFYVVDNKKHNKYWEDLLAGKSIEFENHVLLGKYDFWFSAIMSPVYNAEEKIYKIIFVANDISLEKSRELEIQKLKEELEHKTEQYQTQEAMLLEFNVEYENATHEIENLNDELTEKRKEIENAQNSLEFVQKEIQKRINRAKRIEYNLKVKVKKLEDEITRLKDER